jgi:hypothetical protein
VLGPLEIALGIAALLIGATGTFSPCGLSVIETLGPRGHTGGRPVTLAAVAAFVPGAVIGGLITFLSLAFAGSLLHGAGDLAYFAAAGIAIAAALLEVRGTRIVPQIRRQLPEHWRRVMPMPVAAVLYGVLLGIGFTTFVLSFGVWALAAISFALGEPALGLVLGIGFGLGRALPVAILAPLDGTRTGFKANELMCERPRVYLGLRQGDAAALLAVAVALIVIPGNAGAAEDRAGSATDPTATPGTLVYERLSQEGVIASAGQERKLPGTDPAIGGPYVAVISGSAIKLLDAASLAEIAQFEAPGADGLAVSASWLAYRIRLGDGNDVIFARNLANPAAPGPPLQVASIAAPAQLGRPALDGANLLFAETGPRRSRIVSATLGSGSQRTLLRSRRIQLHSPAVLGDSFAYVRADARRSHLMQRRFRSKGPGRVLFSLRRRNGELWSSFLLPGSAYVTVLDAAAQNPSARILEVSREGRKKPTRRLKRKPWGGGNHKF